MSVILSKDGKRSRNLLLPELLARCGKLLRPEQLAGLATRGASGRLWTMYKTVRNKLHAPTPLYVTPHAHDTPERGDRPSLAL